jgi:hypothetical protein
MKKNVLVIAAVLGMSVFAACDNRSDRPDRDYDDDAMTTTTGGTTGYNDEENIRYDDSLNRNLDNDLNEPAGSSHHTTTTGSSMTTTTTGGGMMDDDNRGIQGSSGATGNSGQRSGSTTSGSGSGSTTY